MECGWSGVESGVWSVGVVYECWCGVGVLVLVWCVSVGESVGVELSVVVVDCGPSVRLWWSVGGSGLSGDCLLTFSYHDRHILDLGSHTEDHERVHHVVDVVAAQGHVSRAR